MNFYLNSNNSYLENSQISIPKNEIIYNELENAREHGLGEEKNITYRIIVDDARFFKPFNTKDVQLLSECLPVNVKFSAKEIPKDNYVRNLVQHSTNSKAALCNILIRDILTSKGYNGIYFLEGEMMAVLMLQPSMCYVTDSAGYNARTAFRRAKGIDPKTGAIILKKTNLQ